MAGSFYFIDCEIYQSYAVRTYKNSGTAKEPYAVTNNNPNAYPPAGKQNGEDGTWYEKQ